MWRRTGTVQLWKALYSLVSYHIVTTKILSVMVGHQLQSITVDPTVKNLGCIVIWDVLEKVGIARGS